VALILTALFASSALNAQDAAPKPLAANTLTGLVTDTLGIPLADVDVLLIKLRRRTRTRADGTFRFDSVPAGTYELRTRAIGFVAPTVRALVGPTGGAIGIRMTRFSYNMPSMVTTAERGGLSGIIGDTAYRALPDVSVNVPGTGHIEKTDSAGAFFIPLKAGKYLARLEREGYQRQMVSVNIPENEGRKIAAWMVPLDGPPNNFEAHMLFEMDQRMTRERGVGTRFYTHEDLVQLGNPSLETVVRRIASGRIDECMVKINGGPVKVPLWTLTADELEFVEIYLPSRTGGGAVTSLKGNPTKFKTDISLRLQAEATCGNLGLMVWLRR
jgi:hypothetical protein